MIINPEVLEGLDIYRCTKNKIMRYLVYKCHIPVLARDKKYYYFTNDSILKECLEEMPLHLKIISLL